MGIFDYAIPEQFQSTIRIGQLVRIPFRNVPREGVVIRLKDTSIAGKVIKPISDIINTAPVLTAEQLRLAEWLSAYYFVSIGAVAKMMLPPIPVRKAKEKQVHETTPTIVKPNESAKKLANTILSGTEKHWLYQPAYAVETQSFIKHYVGASRGTVLIIVPTIQDIDEVKTLLPAKNSASTVIFHGGLGTHDHYQAFESVRTGTSRIIIGTKLALFLPFQNLQHIILTQSENRNHKQSDQNPRYDVRTVVDTLSALHHAKTVFCSHAPTVEQYKLVQDKKWTSLASQIPEGTSPYRIVDMREERKKRESRILSESLIQEMQTSLARKQSVFLYVNRRGSSSSVVCRDCGLVITCPACQQPLVYHTQSKMLFCHQCNVKYPLPSTCKKCGGADFRFLGTGSQQVEQEAKKYFPKHSVVRLDQDTDTPTGDPTADIVIGTELAIPYMDSPRVGVTGIINADSQLYLPDFRSAERTWQQITLFPYLTGQPCVIQTNTPDYPVMSALAQNKPDILYRQELTDRMLLNYPPFTHLFKLIISHPDKNRCVQEAQRVYKMFQPAHISVAILTPLRPLVRQRWYMYVVLKIPFSWGEEKIKALVSQVPEGWQIDREPASLL